MKQERNGIRTKLKAKRAHASPAPPSDDVEFVEDDCHAVEVVDDALVTPGSVKALGKRAREHHSPQHDGKHVREHSGLTPADRESNWDNRRALSMSPTPSLSSFSPTAVESDSLPSTQSSSTSAPPAPPLVMPVHVPSYRHSKHVWPHGMFTRDMAVGFRQMDAPMLRVYYPQEQLFSLIFGVPFVRATYHANHALWLNSHNVKAIRNAHERAGRTPEGLWASYLASRRAALGEKSKARRRS